MFLGAWVHLGIDGIIRVQFDCAVCMEGTAKLRAKKQMGR